MKALILLAMLVAGANPTLAAELPSYIRASHLDAIRTWLDAHSQYRLAIDDDCHCAKDIEDLRSGDGGAWNPQRDIHPYYATGDFDGDGFEDAAVVVLPRGTGAKIAVVIFFGSQAGLTNDVSVVPRNGSSLADRGLFLARTDQRTAHRHAELLFGAFGSEAESVPVKRKRATRANRK